MRKARSEVSIRACSIKHGENHVFVYIDIKVERRERRVGNDAEIILNYKIKLILILRRRLMSAIYILKTKCNQYRVIHAQTIDDLYWSWLPDADFSDLVPTRVVEYFGKCPYTRDANKANRIAIGLAQQQKVSTHDIRMVIIDRTWQGILQEAKKLARQEIDMLRQRDNDLFDVDLQIKNIRQAFACEMRR